MIELDGGDEQSRLLKIVGQRRLHVVFQPIADLRSRSVFGYEALARPDPALFRSPPELFEAAARHDCVGEIGRMIRTMAAVGCPGWPLFLNVHPAEFNEGWLVRPDDPIFSHEKDLYLEITESVPLSHFQQCHSVLREIRSKGIKVAVDGGVATLTGTVGTWIGWGEADKAARRSGATAVLNRVKVKEGTWRW